MVSGYFCAFSLKIGWITRPVMEVGDVPKISDLLSLDPYLKPHEHEIQRRLVSISLAAVVISNLCGRNPYIVGDNGG